MTILPRYTCNRCQYTWAPRIDGRPAQCPRCRSPYWDKERQRPTRGTEVTPKPPARNRRALLRLLPLAPPLARLPKDPRVLPVELEYLGEPPPPWALPPDALP